MCSLRRAARTDNQNQKRFRFGCCAVAFLAISAAINHLSGGVLDPALCLSNPWPPMARSATKQTNTGRQTPSHLPFWFACNALPCGDRRWMSIFILCKSKRRCRGVVLGERVGIIAVLESSMLYLLARQLRIAQESGVNTG